jgi:tetratricopeptide (TPR) repeat protein
MGLEDSRKILQDGQKKRALIIDQTWEIILHYLSGGFPIILDMALEWVEGDSANAAKWLSIENLNKLVHEVGRMEDSRVQLARQEDLKLLSEEALVHLQTAFRHELVSHVSKLKSKDDVLTLTLAKVNPLDIEGIAEVLDVSEQTAKALFERARKRANVKILPDGRIRLTDAMEDLVKLYVWPEVDLEGTRERRDSLRALKYLSRRSDKYLEEIQTLRDQEFAIPHDELFRINQLYNERLAKEQEFWIARTERLERQLFLDPQTGFEDFNKDFDLAAQFGYLVARDSLIRVVRPYVEKLGTLDRLSFQGRLAQHLVRKGQYIDASRIYEQITKEVNPGTKEMVDALIGQGTCLMRAKGGPGLGPSIRRATSKFREALHIASNAEAEQWGRGVVEVQKARALLSLGWAYRAWGLLNESQDFYQRCYRLSLKSGNAVYQALSANGMAYVFSILKDETHAKNYSDETIDIWKKLILEHPEHTEEYRNRLAQAYNTAGEIWIELSQPLLAGRFFQVAVDIFSELSIDEWLSRAVSGRGWARWMLGKTKVLANDTNESVSIDWESALADLEHANELATSLDAPLVLHRLAHTLWDLGQKDQAVNRWIESNRQARQVGDLFTEYNGLCDMANAITETSIPGYSGWIDFQSAREQYFSRNSEVYFPVLDGLFFTYVGNMALLAHEPDVAVQHYKRGLGILCKHFTYLDYNIRGQLKFIHERILPRATVEDMRYVGREMLAFWQRPDSPEELSAPDALGFFMDWSSLKPPREL